MALAEIACRLFDPQKLAKADAASLCGSEPGAFEEELYTRRLPISPVLAQDHEMDRWIIGPLAERIQMRVAAEVLKNTPKDAGELAAE